MSAPTSRTLRGLLAEQAARSPHAPAVVTTSGTTTYADLAERVGLVAGALRGSGVGRGDRVAVLTDNRVEWVEVALASAALGAVLTPFSTWVKTWDLEFLLGYSRPTVLVVLDRLGAQDFLEALRPLLPELWDGPDWSSDRFGDLRAVVVLGEQVPPGAHAWDAWSAGGPARLGDDAVPGDTAMVLYTSGSTARPKAVPLTHGHLVDNAWEIGERQGLTAADRVFVASPLCWAFGSANAMMAVLTHGAALVLQGQFEPVTALDLLEGCTALYTLPAMTRALLTQPSVRSRMAGVRRGVTIGPPVEVRLLVEELGVDLACNIYGSTETYGNCCVTPWDAPASRRIASQGPPLPGVSLRVSGTGEVLVRGRVTPGYLDASGTPVPVVDADGWFATGDLGTLDEDGWLTFAARETDMIKTAGINVSPSEVEDFLLTHPDVAEVAVAGGEDAVRGQRVVAFVRPRDGSDVTPEQLRAHCKATISGYKVPAVVRLVTSFPTTPTGKLSRKDLSALATAALEDA